ncbi:hypothetical protein [Frankia sp. AgB32]|uniref:hypothetical protein n=1 Tax=Frankia sp. AgB32 TaxID=631119 RepID=UPI00200D97FD|nr:hypothetical protein [Frankia sp. AgB32]MCK9894425.1 hypothetical protein [Frankia sp. AgB32]
MLVVFDADPRVQVVFTWTESSPFAHGVQEFLDAAGALTIPWSQAMTIDVDLAITARPARRRVEGRAAVIGVTRAAGCPGFQRTVMECANASFSVTVRPSGDPTMVQVDGNGPPISPHGRPMSR